MGENTHRTANAVSGSLSVDAVHRNGQTCLDSVFCSVPFHISKPYWDGTVLLLQVANPTAGLFSGDQLSCRVQVKENAALLFTNQGASRIHPSTGAGVVSEQTFRVSDKGWLEIFPELLIPYRQASLIQKTVVNVADGGRAYLAEMLAPGRTAAGEIYAYEKLDWRFHLFLHDRPIAVERAEISPDTIPWMFASPPHWQHIYYGCVWIVAPELEAMSSADFKEIEDLSSDECLVGASRLAATAIVVKVVSSSSIPLRKALQSTRSRMVALLPFLHSNPHKL